MADTEFPGDRPVDYDADKIWDEANGVWGTDEDMNIVGGGRFRTQIVTVCSGKIFFEEIE